MKYYSDDEMKHLRTTFEETVLHWPQVSTKMMFGCPCYQVNGRLFAFLVTNGLVITQLDKADREALSNQHQTTFFQAGKKIVRGWVRLSTNNKKDLDRLMPYVRKGYESALRKE